jgi:acyl-CoA synthetase (AMP-forming)/AMP-acid ligase II
MTLIDLLGQRAKQHGKSTFLIVEDSVYSFRAVHDAALRFATMLQTLGAQPNEHVALIAKNSAAYIIAWMGISAAGCVAVTLNTQSMGAGLRHSLIHSDAKIIVADAAWFREKLPRDFTLAELPRVEIDSDADLLAELRQYERADPVPVSDSSACTLIYTSGTTGIAKGVINSHACYLAVGRETANLIALTAQDRCMVVLPMFHANPQMYAVMSALVVGSALIIRGKFSASSFFDDARRFAATGFTFVGTLLAILAARHTNRDLEHKLRFCMGGGAPLGVWKAVEDRFGVRVHELYGMTEIGGWVTANGVADRRIGSCGRVRKDMDVRIFDANECELPAGQDGEIVVRPLRPDVILSGYYKEPDKMMEATRNLWFHTGDQGYFDADGYLYFRGRIKELIRRGGEMISPVEIETVLRRLPGVIDCAAVGVDDDILGQEIKVVVVRQDPALSVLEITQHLAAHLPPFMHARYIEFVQALPKTETEKVQRHKIAHVSGGVIDLNERAQGAAHRDDPGQQV